MLPSKKHLKVGLIENPALGLYDTNDRNWTALYRRHPLHSKQVLMGNLQAGGFDVELVNLRNGDHKEDIGEIYWKDMKLTATAVGKNLSNLDPTQCDAWGITVNYMQERHIAGRTIKYLAKGGRPIVVGGSDTLFSPEYYLNAGASAVVLDKSGSSNWHIMNYVLKKGMRNELSNVILSDGTKIPKQRPILTPEEWQLPSIEISKQCFGNELTEEPFLKHLVPIGSVIPDIGCDRKCDFCQTPKYGIGYNAMSSKKVIAWLNHQKAAGAKSVVITSDQFLGRLHFKHGRQDIFDIMQAARDLNLPILWINGLDLAKMNLNSGKQNKSSTFIPDKELIKSLWGWDGKKGCFLGYIPAERPLLNTDKYSKLLSWQHHRELMKCIVKVGIPVIIYGVIIGYPDDNHDNLSSLENAIKALYDELYSINPALNFQVAPYSIFPIPGTSLRKRIVKKGLLRFDNPEILGGFWTPCCDTHHMSYKDISNWQFRLTQIGKIKKPDINYYGGLTMLK